MYAPTTVAELLALTSEQRSALRAVVFPGAEKVAACPRCVSCVDCAQCVDCVECEHCWQCDACALSTDCRACVGCVRCVDCTKCVDCLLCVGVIGGVMLRYVAWGFQLTRDEYLRL